MQEVGKALSDALRKTEIHNSPSKNSGHMNAVLGVHVVFQQVLRNGMGRLPAFTVINIGRSRDIAVPESRDNADIELQSI